MLITPYASRLASLVSYPHLLGANTAARVPYFGEFIFQALR
jgi:hypothetical protein